MLSHDQELALKQARELLGYQYLESPEKLRMKLSAAIQNIKQPVNLKPLKDGGVYRFFISLIRLGIPIQKLFPHPFLKIKEYLFSFFKLNQLTVVYGSDFSHYRVSRSSGLLKFKKVFAFQLGASAKSGLSVRDRASILKK